MKLRKLWDWFWNDEQEPYKRMIHMNEDELYEECLFRLSLIEKREYKFNIFNVDDPIQFHFNPYDFEVLVIDCRNEDDEEQYILRYRSSTLITDCMNLLFPEYHKRILRDIKINEILK